MLIKTKNGQSILKNLFEIVSKNPVSGAQQKISGVAALIVIFK